MPSTAMESAFSDILAWLVATTMRGLHSCDTGEVVCRETAVIQEGLLPSLQGGIPTAMSVIDKYGIGWLLSPKPWALSPEPKPTKLDGSSSSLGYKNVSGLGTLSTSPIAIINRSVVNRSWGLMPETYGPHFHYQEYLPSRNAFTAMLIHIATKIGFLLLGVPLVRWLIRCSVKLLPYILPPENAGHHQKDHFEFRAIGTADGTKNKARVGARFAYDGSGYWLCAFIAVEAAVVLLKEEETQMKKKMGGGLLTPSTLGMVYVERLRKAGATIEAEAMV
ncbi:MAG: hypothetical protein M1834_005009 [Cirrosporium novae-zelandiae]|nr:MAG: hypothetical protein M1834_005009 [Cirrosporium novae-zelandiae]